MKSIQLETNELLMYHCGCHANPVTIAVRSVADCVLSLGKLIANMNSIWLKAKELLTYHCGWHGNLVTKATKNVADAYHPKEPPYQI